MNKWNTSETNGTNEISEKWKNEETLGKIGETPHSYPRKGGFILYFILYYQSEGLGTDYDSSWAHELPGVCSRSMDSRRRRRWRRRQQRQLCCRVDLTRSRTYR